MKKIFHLTRQGFDKTTDDPNEVRSMIQLGWNLVRIQEHPEISND